MSMTAQTWIQQLAEEIAAAKAEESALFSPFSLEALTEAYQTITSDTQLGFGYQLRGWKEENAVYEGIGFPSFQVEIVLSSMTRSCYFIISEQSVLRLWCAYAQISEQEDSFFRKEMMDAFLRYFLLDLCSSFDTIRWIPFVPSLHQVDYLTEALCVDRSFVIDVTMQYQQHPLPALLVIPSVCLDEMKLLLLKRRSSESKHIEGVTIPVICEVGSVTLPQSEWDQVQIGDVVVLDRCLFDPDHQTGNTYLLVQNKMVWIGTITPEGVIIKDEVMELEEEKSLSEEFSQEESAEEESAENCTITCVFHHIDVAVSSLLQLQIGDMIPWGAPLRPHVELMIQERCVATGVVLQLGELVGVRIATLASPSHLTADTNTLGAPLPEDEGFSEELS